MNSIERFLEEHSGKIVGVGDIFDYKRSSVTHETMNNYLIRTEKWWRHIETFVIGNHDAQLLNRCKDRFNSVRIYKNNNVLAIHGHQLRMAFEQARIIKYESNWSLDLPFPSILKDIEEWTYRTFNKYFTLQGKRKYAQALATLSCIDNANLLDDNIDTIITGHTHLPFDTTILFKGRRIRVMNLGSSLHGKKFNPEYVKSIDRYFVSDLHLGTNKSKLN